MRSRIARFLVSASAGLFSTLLAIGLVYAVVDPAAEGSTATQQETGPSSSGTVLPTCGAASGTRFNLEPRTDPVPQNETAVDFLPGSGLSGGDLVVGGANDFRLLTSGTGTPGDFRGVFGMTNQTGYYVHRNGSAANPCSADFEGGFPSLKNPNSNGTLVGVGDPAVVADPARQAFFFADERAGLGETFDSAVAVFRTTAATLNNSTSCPNGTHSEAAARSCWPTSILLDIGTIFSTLDIRPNLALDERADGGGVGAGDLYVSAARASASSVFIAVCRNNLSACSSSIKISGSDIADNPHIAVRPDGGITATYTVSTSTGLDIKWVTCTPNGAPNAPTCMAATRITSESQILPYNPFGGGPGLAAAQFVIRTFPKHTHRQDSNGTETYVIWDRCKVSTSVTYPGITFTNVCADADLRMAASNNNGQTWTVADVDTAVQDQFQPWIGTDASTNIVNIVYYSSQADAFQHRSKVLLRQIAPGSSTPDPVGAAQTITTVGMDPAADPFLQGIYMGDYIGLSARAGLGGSRAYIHYTHSAIAGIYNGARDPEQNNHLSRFDY